MSESTGAPASEAPAEAKKGFVARVIGVILSPGETFEDVRRKPTIIVPLLVLMVLFGVANYVLIPISMPEQGEFLERSPQFQQLTQAQQDAQIGFFKNTPSWFAPVMAVVMPIGLLLVILLYTLLLWGGGHFLGGDPKFKAVLSMMLFASMIHPILNTLVKLPLIISKQSVLSVTMSPAVFMPDLEVASRMFMGLNTFFDLFTVWGAIVGGIGLSKVAKISLAKGMTVVIVVYLIRSTLLYLQTASSLG